MADWVAEDLERAMTTLYRIGFGTSVHPEAEAITVVETLGNQSMRDRAKRSADGND